MKLCSKCQQNLEDIAFTRSPTTGKLASYCKQCQHEYDEARKEQRKLYSKIYYENNKDKYKNYLERKREYEKQPEVRQKKNEYMKEYNARPEVQERRKKYQKLYSEQNKERIAQNKARYREQNRERINAAQRLWYANNREKYLSWVNQIDRRIGNAISKSIYHKIRGNKSEQHWENLVDFSLDELMKHLELQFTPEMNWDNYGEYWEIDHIIPVSMFNFTKDTQVTDKEFKICWSLMNLRPLNWLENRKRPKDGSDISEEIKQQILNQFS